MDLLTQNKDGVPIGKTFGGYEGTIGGLISTVINFAFVISGVIILFMVVFAGYQIIQGAGSGKSESTEKAKQAATYAAVGFAIIFTAYWLIRLIELITGSTFITAPAF